MSINVNVDPSSAPSWLVALLLAGGLVAELLDDPKPAQGVDVATCTQLCWYGVETWTPYQCTCLGLPEAGSDAAGGPATTQARP